MMGVSEVLGLKLQLYDSRERFLQLIGKINRAQEPEGVSTVFELIAQIYTEKIALLDIILNHADRKEMAGDEMALLVQIPTTTERGLETV